MRKDLHEYYRALGLNPGASAEEIKRAYRQLVQTWHPDHFKAGSLMQTTAEDITKEINEAYEQLYKKQLYKKFLPKADVRRPAPAAPSPQARQTYEKASATRREPPVPPPPRPPRAKPPSSRWTRSAAPFPPRREAPAAAPRKNPRLLRFWPWAGAAAAIAVVFIAMVIVKRTAAIFARNPSVTHYAVDARPAAAAQNRPRANPARAAAPVGPERTAADASTGRNRVPAADQTQLNPIPDPVFFGIEVRSLAAPGLASASAFPGGRDIPTFTWPQPRRAGAIDERVGLLDAFEVGDFKSKVLTVQGAPDDMGENIYRYGSSVVYFANGRVTGWLDRRPKLRVHALPGLEFAGLSTFTLGSSRSEVFQTQGQPSAVTQLGYYYGSSVIYFENDRVAGWTEGSLQLRTRLIPALPFSTSDRPAGR